MWPPHPPRVSLLRDTNGYTRRTRDSTIPRTSPRTSCGSCPATIRGQNLSTYRDVHSNWPTIGISQQFFAKRNQLTFVTTSELFDSPLNCLMTDGITYYSAFPEDTVFGAIINSYQFQCTGSCIANPEYEPEDMLKAILHAMASSESTETPFLFVLILPIWGETP